MTRTTPIGTAVLNTRTVLAIGRGTWRLRAGRLPWQRRGTTRRRGPKRRG